MPSLTVDGVRYPVQPGDTVLDAMHRGGAFAGVSCYAGDCGLCKCELVSGAVVELEDTAGALGAGERARNVVLGCRTRIDGDVVAHGIRDDERIEHPYRTMQTRVVSVEAITHDIKRFRLEVVGEPLEFSAGQYAKVTFAPGVHREYSMANPPHDPVLEFHVRRTANGMASNHVWSSLAVGDTVDVKGPLGSCYLRERHSAPILLAGGGSGMAPMLSILESALHLGMSQAIRLYFGVRDDRDVYAIERLDALEASHPNFHYEIALSSPEASAGDYRTGMLHEILAADWDRLSIGKAYLAGPPVMVEAVSGLLRSRGVALRNIHADAYYTEAEKAKLQSAAKAVNP